MLRALLAGLLATVAASKLETQLDRANVLVYKELRAPGTQDILVVGRNFSVTYYVMNLGEGDAINVKVKDDWPFESFDVVEGAAERTWVTLPR